MIYFFRIGDGTMNYKTGKDYRDNDALRHSFNKLATETFGLSFESWYQNGYWREKYIPYSIVVDGIVISNVSVNLIDCILNGKIKHYIQLGTVMTKKSHRGNGYCRILMETVLHDYAMCDGFFLFANDSVLDFYPKFGFQSTQEYRFCPNISHKSNSLAEPISMKTKQDWVYFLKEKKLRSSNGVLQLNTDGLTMFYLTQFMQNNVYYIKTLDAYVIAEIDNDTLILYDVFSKGPVDMIEVCNSFGNSITKAKFAFVPKETKMLEKYEYKEPNTTFFVRGDNLLQDMGAILSFPEIVHA